MFYSKIIVKSRIIKRYKRFFVDCQLDNGDTVVSYLSNTGSMKTVFEADWTGYLLYDPAPTRKLDYRLISVEKPDGTRIGVDTSLANSLVEQALQNKTILAFERATHWKREAVFTKGTRFDFQVFFGDDKPSCFLEVKNVQMSRQQGVAEFPDAVTTRGAKHWDELVVAKQQGYDAVLCFCIQRDDVTSMTLASDIDPDYVASARKAIAAGVQVYAYKCVVTPENIEIVQQVPFVLP